MNKRFSFNYSYLFSFDNNSFFWIRTIVSKIYRPHFANSSKLYLPVCILIINVIKFTINQLLITEDLILKNAKKKNTKQSVKLKSYQKKKILILEIKPRWKTNTHPLMLQWLNTLYNLITVVKCVIQCKNISDEYSKYQTWFVIPKPH